MLESRGLCVLDLWERVGIVSVERRTKRRKHARSEQTTKCFFEEERVKFVV